MASRSHRSRRHPHGMRCSTTLATAALAVCIALPARAQEGPRPTLGGHQFVSTDLIPDAFVRTYVRNSIGYSQTAEFDYPPVVIRGDTLLALDGSLAYANLGMEYQHAIRDWLAVRVGLGLRTRLGTQVSSILSEGVSVNSGFEFGWLARVRQTQRTMMSASLAVTSQNLTVVDVRQFTEDVIDGVADPSLIDDVPAVRSAAGLRFAWAASRPVGVTLLLEGSYGETPRRDEAESWEYGMGASVDFDAGAAWDVPIGLALAYRQTSLPVVTTTDNGNVSETVLRLAYTGKPDFLIALDIMGVLDRENLEADSVWAGGAAFSLRYYF
jgi:hypothetical protein